MSAASPPTVDELVVAVDAQLKHFSKERRNLTLRDKVLCLVGMYKDVKRLNVAAVVQENGFDARSAQKRILTYLLEYPGVVIDGPELEVISGISEYARRIRELRKERGYQIATGASPDPESGIDLRPDQYLLVTNVPDEQAAARWHIANRIRKSSLSSRDRILAFLQENVGSIVTTEELAYVAKDAKEYARRTRELRTEFGYAISTKVTGRPDLAIGQYVLEDAERVAEPHDRKIPAAVQADVYERDSNSCQICGWDHSKWTADRPRILELHHVEQHADGGHNTKENLITLCSRCHDDVHAGTKDCPQPRT